jgi:hypothetical protein
VQWNKPIPAELYLKKIFMKKRIFLAAIATIGLFSEFRPALAGDRKLARDRAFEQGMVPGPGGKKQLPPPVAVSFQSRYGTVKVKKWEKLDGQYVIRFVDNTGAKCNAYYSPEGVWARTERTIPMSKDLPVAVRRGLEKSDYANWYIDNIREIRTTGEVRYRIHVDNGDLLDSDHYDAFRRDFILWFTPEGSLETTRVKAG